MEDPTRLYLANEIYLIIEAVEGSEGRVRVRGLVVHGLRFELPEGEPEPIIDRYDEPLIVPAMWLVHTASGTEFMWQTLRVDEVADGRSLVVEGLVVSNPQLPHLALRGNLALKFDSDGRWDRDGSTVTLTEPAWQGNLSTLALELERGEEEGVTPSLKLEWSDGNLAPLLTQLFPGLFTRPADVPARATLRVQQEDQQRALRLDWTLDDAWAATLSGNRVTFPVGTTLSATLAGGTAGLPLTALELAANPDGQLTFESGFGWKREIAGRTLRELQPDPVSANGNPLSIPLPEGALTLLRTTLGGGATPRFLPADPPRALEPRLDTALTFPFLYKEGNGRGSIGQQLRVTSIGAASGGRVPLDVKVTVGALELDTTTELVFDPALLAFDVEHAEGIALGVEESYAAEYLGLRWQFRGAGENGSGALFTLVTRDADYQLQLAPGAELVLSYSELSDDPIRFRVREFALGANGVTLSAEVLDDPAVLNGIDTRFRFADSRLEIIDNVLQDFTLRGSGPLPPDLVGETMVDIALQYSRTAAGAPHLVATTAQLQGEQPLECRATRFQFEVDTIDLKFVRDNGVHLYFTLTGAASFTLGEDEGDGHPLELLPGVELKLIDCPLTGDASVLARHIEFLVEFPEPLSFSFLGAFEMELRGIGFVPELEAFDGDAAMQLSGQFKFVDGQGDQENPSVDFNNLYIGGPAEGKRLPRVYVEEISLAIEVDGRFKLAGTVGFVESGTQSGFYGSGMIDLNGLPSLSAAFAFMRVREDRDSPWRRAWFIYLQVGKLSIEIPKIRQFIREIGLGFGYRYTLVSIATADDEEIGIIELARKLRDLSRTQGELTRIENWAVDLEKAGQDPRWNIVLRALLTQNSASASPLRYNEAAEEKLPNAYLLEVVAAFRSDLTFFMALRGWLNTNYHAFLDGDEELRDNPTFSGYAILTPRRKRFLAHASSNPEGYIGDNPRLPAMVKDAMLSSQASITMLVEPGLFHFELGWPDMLRWTQGFGPATLTYSGGLIIRVDRRKIVLGMSYVARGRLYIEASYSATIVGVTVRAEAVIGFGGRFIGAATHTGSDKGDMVLYAAVGLEIRCRFSIEGWVDLLLIRESIEFSLDITFTASLDIGYRGDFGIRARGTISVKVAGRSLRIGVEVGHKQTIVAGAYQEIKDYINLGLDATDHDTFPGAEELVDGGGRGLGDESLDLLEDFPVSPLEPPHYQAYVIRTGRPAENGRFQNYLVLLPVDAAADGSPSPGFLPVPPNGSPEADFTIAANGHRLHHLEPGGMAWSVVGDEGETGWHANWDHRIITAEPANGGEPRYLSLKDYLRYAFVGANGALGDPAPLGEGEVTLVDGRVQNPSDEAYEAAVRGAVEQFRGSPYFKRDPAFEYDRALGAAFDPNTSVYTDNEGADLNSETVRANRRAHEFRGLIYQSLVTDLQKLARDPQWVETDEARRSVAVQMGLIFGYDGDDPAADDALFTIRQRMRDQMAEVAQPVHPFNPALTDFDNNPPRFERVRHYTDAGTIAITWDLDWSYPTGIDEGKPAADPEHHLMHYEVRRRSLDAGERDVHYTVKSAQTLHREGAILKKLAPRFQIVDHFGAEEVGEMLPAEGRRYLYTITPVDFAEHRGQPLTLVATRFPSEPPQVPTDGEFRVTYEIDAKTLGERMDAVPEHLSLVEPAALELSWNKPAPRAGREVPVKSHYLVFRRERTLPIGSYVADGMTQRDLHATSSASEWRRLPTDRAVEIGKNAKGEPTVTLAQLREAGVFPKDAEGWRPESWQLYLQSVSINGVPSPLAPVRLFVVAEVEGHPPLELHPGGLEWLPRPFRLPLLPPEDLRASQGTVHVPRPVPDEGALIEMAPHPSLRRMIEFQWNQGPSRGAGARFPLELIAGYDLLELDIDAHPRDTFHDRERLARAVRAIQEIRMLPGAELPFVPDDTQTTSQWEAWYPSSVRRLEGEPNAAEAPWYSWRDSLLIWPQWPGVTDVAPERARPTTALHPALETILERLEAGGYHVEVQRKPPRSTGTLAEFLTLTAPESDPYGWGVLQHLGLSVALSLRDPQGRPVLGSALEEAIADAVREARSNEFAEQSISPYLSHLFVEFLFQPTRSRRTKGGPIDRTALLATIQLGMRPLVEQLWHYLEFEVTGTENGTFELDLPGFTEVIDSRNPGSLVEREDGRYRIAVREGDEITLWVRSRGPILALGHVEDAPATVSTTLIPLDDPRTAYFAPVALAREFEDRRTTYQTQWHRLAAYLASLSATEGEQIRVPVTGLEGNELFETLLGWTDRFFDHGIDPSAGRVGPHLATAYPYAGTPAPASPDAGGRLRYHHLVPDPWAHTLRYYLRPYGRYDRLWEAIAQYAGKPASPRVAPEDFDTQVGGLDVILARTRPISKPVVLSSRRLDLPPPPGEPARPGSRWEVIVAQHPEQALAERNQTLARKLAFRQIAFSLERRFLYEGDAYLDELRTYLKLDDLPREATSTGSDTSFPTSLPERPDHLDLADLSAEEALALALSARLGRFQQGAIVLHWEALPFYYEHRLRLIAQGDHVVSEVNHVTQRAFDYVSPDPDATGRVRVGDDKVTLELRLPLARLWDSLPEAAKQRWPSEEPDRAPKGVAALPDPEVVYQFVTLAGSDLELQAELAWMPKQEVDDEAGDEAVGFVLRALGGQLTFTPDAGPTAPDQPGAPYTLGIAVEVPGGATSESLSVPISSEARVILAERSDLTLRDLEHRRLVWVGPISEEETAAIRTLAEEVDEEMATALRRLVRAARQPLAVTVPPGEGETRGLPTPLRIVTGTTGRTLVWEGAMSAQQRAALQRFTSDDDSALEVGVRRLLARLDERVADEELHWNRQATVPGLVQAQAYLESEDDPESDAVTYSELNWYGLVSERNLETARRWARLPTLRRAIDELARDTESTSMGHPPPIPTEMAESVQLILPSLVTVEEADGSVRVGWQGRAWHVEQLTILELMSRRQEHPDLAGVVGRIHKDLSEWTHRKMLEADSSDALATPPADTFIVVEEEPGLTVVTWVGPMVDERHEAARKWAAAQLDGAEQRFINDLIDEIGSMQEQFQIAPEVIRPGLTDVPTSLADHLSFHLDRIEWRGRPTGELVAALEEVAVQAEQVRPDLAPALRELLLWLEGGHTIPLDPTIPLPPAQGNLSGVLRSKLLIASASIEREEPIGSEDFEQWHALLDEWPADQRALERLFRATIRRALGGVELSVVTRRGNAGSNGPVPITFESRNGGSAGNGSDSSDDPRGEQ